MRRSFYLILGVFFSLTTALYAQTPDALPGANSVSTLGLKYVQSGMNSTVASDFGIAESQVNMTHSGKKKAILASLVLPGTGERMLGADGLGTFFTATETVLWLGLIGFSAYSGWREQDYRSYAKHHAAVNAKGKDGQYWINIAGYDNIHEYNTVKLQRRRPEEVYPVTEEYSWDWESYETRYKYDTIRIESRVVSQYATFTVGAIILNHLASALDATYLYNSQFNATENSVSYHIAIPLP